MKKIAVVLAGCGFKDGAEITESVSTLIALSEAGVTYQAFAPNKSFNSTNHQDDSATGERNVMAESSRITRGEITPLSELNSANFDAIVFPGGFGAAMHLCTFATEGAGCSVDKDAERVIKEFNNEGKPVGAFCISPALVAKVLGYKEVTVTIGSDEGTASEIEKTGAQHENCNVDDYITDRENKIVTSPAYMYGEASPFEVYKGIRGAIRELVEMS